MHRPRTFRRLLPAALLALLATPLATAQDPEPAREQPRERIAAPNVRAFVGLDDRQLLLRQRSHQARREPDLRPYEPGRDGEGLRRLDEAAL